MYPENEINQFLSMKNHAIVDLDKLDGYLMKINSIFPIENIVDNDIGHDKIVDYYNDSSTAYKYLHSKEGAVHMAINYDGRFNKMGYYTQLNEILEQINSSKVKSVLELGCGKGFNSKFLSKKKKKIQFIGIDISDKHLTIANNKSANIENLKFTRGDFHALDFEDSSFDLIFGIETICYTNDLKQVLNEIHRTLNKGGKLILYDGFRNNNTNLLNRNLFQAVILTERSMAANKFEEIDNWLHIAEEVGFKIESKSDLSEAIMPNLARLQHMSRAYYKYPKLSKIIYNILPRNLVMNSIAGLLMPFTVHHHAHSYYRLVLEKI